MKRILVTGAGSDAGRNVVAALRMADERLFIVGADTNAFHLACADVDATYLVPVPTEGGYLDALLDIVSSERITYVLPQPERDLAFLSDHRSELPGVLFLPDHADVVAAQNRLHCNRLLQAAEVPVPAVVRLHRGIDARAALEDVSEYAGRSGGACVRTVRAQADIGTLPVSTGEQVESWLNYWAVQSGLSATEFVLSTLLPGRTFAFHSLWSEGRLVTSTAVERMDGLSANRGLPGPVSAGPSVARTVHREDVNTIAQRAIQALSPRPRGPFTVMLREDAAGTPRVTDLLAGRYPETIDFLAAAGVNLPWQQVRMAYGSSVPALPRFDPVEDELYWVRSVDRKPHLFKGAPWVHRRAA